MVLSNVVFVVTVLSSSSVFSQACVQVSARLANVSCWALTAFDLVYRSLSVLGSTLSLTLVSSCRKVVLGLRAMRIPCSCRIRTMVSEVSLMYGTVAIVTVVGLVFVKLDPLYL